MYQVSQKKVRCRNCDILRMISMINVILVPTTFIYRCVWNTRYLSPTSHINHSLIRSLKWLAKTPQTRNVTLKGYSEIFWSGAHFSSHILILLYILKELSYTNLTSIGLLRKQNGFDKIGRSVHFLISMSGHRNYSTVFNGDWRSIIHVIPQRKIIANRNFEHKLSKWVFINGYQRKRVLESTRNLWILL